LEGLEMRQGAGRPPFDVFRGEIENLAGHIAVNTVTRHIEA